MEFRRTQRHSLICTTNQNPTILHLIDPRQKYNYFGSPGLRYTPSQIQNEEHLITEVPRTESHMHIEIINLSRMVSIYHKYIPPSSHSLRWWRLLFKFNFLHGHELGVYNLIRIFTCASTESKLRVAPRVNFINSHH